MLTIINDNDKLREKLNWGIGGTHGYFLFSIHLVQIGIQINSLDLTISSFLVDQKQCSVGTVGI